MSHTVLRSLHTLKFQFWLQRVCAMAATMILSVGSTACSTARPWLNEALTSQERVRYDGFEQLLDGNRLRDVLVVASFSGGGTRAAAFAHALLSELDAMPFSWGGRQTTLAQEVDMVIGVSGGSVAATHLALHGVRNHLELFPGDFLERDFQGDLIRSALNPRNLYRLSSPLFGRGQLLAEQFDEQLFKGATFGSLAQLANRPYLLIGATDLSSGAQFNFSSDRMALLCSSIDRVPLAFATAASSAVPVVLSPLTLQNHSQSCTQLRSSLPGGAVTAMDPARVRLVKVESESIARGEREFIHLVDGGVSDNLGTRRLTDYVGKTGGIGAVMSLLGVGQAQAAPAPRRIVLISANSESHGAMAIDSNSRVPSMFEVLNAVLIRGLGRASIETSLVLGDSVDQWRKELRSDPRFANELDTDIFSIEVKLTDLDDPVKREEALNIPTAFRITPAHRALLRLAAQNGLAKSEDLKRFLASVKATQ
jgi:NTE family protein